MFTYTHRLLARAAITLACGLAAVLSRPRHRHKTIQTNLKTHRACGCWARPPTSWHA